MLQPSLIYKLFAMYIFVHQANQSIEILKLPQESITNLAQLTAGNIGSPRFYLGDYVGLVGFLETKNFHIGRDRFFGVTALSIDQLNNGKGQNCEGATAPEGALKQVEMLSINSRVSGLRV